MVLENESVRAVFTTRGGALKSWRLKKYQDAAKAPLEIVPQDAPAGLPKPFTLSVDDPRISAVLSQALFRPSATTIDARNGPATLVFEYADATGLSARKQLSFHPQNPYVVHLSASVNQGDKPLVPTVHWGPAIGNALSLNTSGYIMPPRPILHRDGDVERVNVADIAEVANAQGTFGFTGVDDHYFMTAAVTLKEPVTLHFEPVALPARDSAEDPPPPYVSWSIKFSGQPNGAAFFAGPKGLRRTGGSRP